MTFRFTMYQEKDLKEIATKISNELELIYDKKMGFALLVFEFFDAGIGDYVSNAERKDMIDALRETADRLERKQDIPKTIGEA